ncbi:helix-turn-helix transcriptional regulator [Brevibacillus sp. GCM10020057]|uniref:helix-turn-helix transcriptional regulator n=1 Tax=Brevibacillus sp. GCM10020057 TaxID=3317327 RepID=UPI00363DB974
MRADRLVSILLLLQNHGRMTAKELAEKLEVSERTIHRDMEALGMAGVPVFAERGSNGGWALTEGYRTDLTGLKQSELQSLLLVSPTNQLDDLGMRASFDAAWQKLLAASPASIRQNAEHARQRIHIDGAGWHQVEESFPCLATVQEAVWQERALFIRYQRGEDSVERIVHPLGLVAKRSTWYFVAHVDSELRTYRISRLIEAHMLEDSFVRPEGFDLASYWEQSTADFRSSLPRYPARIRVLETLLPRLMQERYIQIKSTQPAESGWVEAFVHFETLESACEIVLACGPRIVVLEPGELRARVTAEAAAILGLY